MKIKISEIFSIKNESDFNDIALKIFNFQYANNKVYRNYIEKLNTDVSKIKHYTQIPFLPIDFFKTHKIVSSDKKTQSVFRSSGTSEMIRSEHHIADLNIYEKSFTETFRMFYGNPKDYVFSALLPKSAFALKKTCKKQVFSYNNVQINY